MKRILATICTLAATYATSVVLLMAIAVPMTSMSSCAHYVVHPGAVSTVDSRMYDGILTAKSIIDTSRDEFNTGVLPARLKPLVNAIVKAYDDANPAYQEWHTAMTKGTATPDQLTKVTDYLRAMDAAILAFRSAK